MGEVITIILAFVFIMMFRHVPAISEFFSGVLRLEGVSHIEILALPLAFSIGNIFNYIALWRIFNKDFPEINAFPLLRTTLQTTVASLCMGAVAYGSLNIFALMFNQERFWGVFFQGLFAGLFGLTIFITVLLMVKNEDMIDIYRSIKKKFWKKTDILVEQSEVDNLS
jgi:uncharacterized membrane protein